MELSKQAEPIRVHDRMFASYITEHQIHERILQLAAQLNWDYEGKNPLFMGVLNGSFMFVSDLMKHIGIPCEVTFIRVSSYEGITSTGKVQEILGLNQPVVGRHIVILEDIIDTGTTIQSVLKQLKKSKPESITTASLLFKPSRLLSPFTPDYIGFEVPDQFLLGYGLDYNGQGRNLNHIYTEILS